MKRLSIPFLLGLLCLFVFVLSDSYGWIGRSFPGFLAFENGLPGRFFLPGWNGPGVFLFKDYLGVVVLPAAAGLLFAVAGAVLAEFIGRPGRPLFLFHFLVGIYLVLSPDFQMAHRFSYPELLAFVSIPAVLLHFALEFPEGREGGPSIVAPYVVSALLAIPYLWLFKSRPAWWAVVEMIVVLYVAGAYIFWMARLAALLRRPQREGDRLLARYLLRGQWSAFSIPLAASIAIFAARIAVPLNLASPVILLFPAAVFVGGLLARLHESQMRLVASERMATLGNALGGIAHELKNPLNFVVANLDVLKEKASSQEMKEIVADIEEGAERMRTILDDFRFFLEPVRKPEETVDVNDVVIRASALLKPRCGDRIAVNLVLGEVPPIQGRRGELGQAVLNLLSNAVDAVLQNGEGEVAVTTEKRGGEILIEVKDNGPGISPENLRRIFDPFFTTKPQGQGTGLGLALTERIVREHGGRVEVRSEEGKGSGFRLFLHL